MKKILLACLCKITLRCDCLRQVYVLGRLTLIDNDGRLIKNWVFMIANTWVLCVYHVFNYLMWKLQLINWCNDVGFIVLRPKLWSKKMKINLVPCMLDLSYSPVSIPVSYPPLWMPPKNHCHRTLRPWISFIGVAL